IFMLAPKVIRDHFGRYIMFYSALKEQWNGHIRTALSTDGLKWSIESGIRIDAKDLNGGPYSIISPSDFVQISENQYRLYFTADRYPPDIRNRFNILSAIVTILPPVEDFEKVAKVLSSLVVFRDKNISSRRKQYVKKAFLQHLLNSLENQLADLTNCLNELRGKTIGIEKDLQRIRFQLDQR
ncbi:hypothetical protein HYY75_06570, partial [bacterium]|nr:hypothetical protein [bacterium]